jgi:virginiamycin B lyase
VGHEGDLWFTANAANKIGRMRPDGTMVGEYPIPVPGAGARCIAPMSNGRLYVTLFDAGMIGEIIPQ